VQRGLKADLGLLDGHHGLFQADRRIFQLHLLLQARGLVLRFAHSFQGSGQHAGEAARVLRCRRGAGDRAGPAGQRGGDGGQSEVHAAMLGLAPFALASK
jgi:hypothetical protein